MRLIVEVDGGQHNIYKQKDKIRDEWLKKEGDKVLRFWDNEAGSRKGRGRGFLTLPYAG